MSILPTSPTCEKKKLNLFHADDGSAIIVAVNREYLSFLFDRSSVSVCVSVCFFIPLLYIMMMWMMSRLVANCWPIFTLLSLAVSILYVYG